MRNVDYMIALIGFWILVACSSSPKDVSKVDALLINKIDVAPYFDFDMDKLREYVGKLNKKVKIFPISAKTGEGVSDWTDWLLNEVQNHNK